MTDHDPTASGITVHDADGFIVPDAAGVLRGPSAEHIEAHNAAVQRRLDDETQENA